MAWHFQTDDYVTVADSSVLTLPNSDWMLGGWVRIASVTGTGWHRILEAGASDGPRFLIFFLDNSAGYSNDGCFSAYVSDGTNNTGVIYISATAGKVGSLLNKWVYLSLSHNSGTTYLKVLNPTTNLYYTASKSQALGAVNPATDLYFGCSPSVSLHLNGDLANWSMWNVDATQAPLYAPLVRGRQPYRYGGICQWHVPMLGGRYEEWKNQLAVTNYGTTDPGDNPNRLQLITPYPLTLAPLSATSVLIQNPASTLELEQTASCVNEAASHAADMLSLSQTAGMNIVKRLAGSNPIMLAQMPDYVGPKSADAISFIEPDTLARVPDTRVLSAASSIAITQSTWQGGTRRVGATSVLAIADVADNIVKIRQATTQLDITSTAGADKILTAKSVLAIQQLAQLGSVQASASSQIALSQAARYSPRRVGAASQINLTHSVWSNIRKANAASELNVSQHVTVTKPIRASASHSLTATSWVFDPALGVLVEENTGLRDRADVVPSSRKSVVQYVSLAQTAVVAHVKASGSFVNAFDSLTITQDARPSKTGVAASTLVFTHTATAQAGRLAEARVVLSQAAASTIDRGCSVETTLGVRQAAAYTLILASTRSQYSPFVGESTDPNAPSPPPASLHGPMAGIQVPFQLVHPSVGTVTSSVSLKAPNLGNKDRLAFNRISRETRGGTVIVFADPDWPKIQTQVVQFSGLLRVEAQALLAFIEDHLGEEVGMIDWEHRYWRGIITVPDEPVVEDRFDSFTASFQFEGELDPAWNPQVVPPTLRYSATRTPQEGGYYVPNEPILPVTPETSDYLTAETDSNVAIGQPVYIKSTGHLDLASASVAPQVAGVAISDTAATIAAHYITEGKVIRTDWTPIVGTVSLLAGVTYFLDTAAGRLTAAAPAAAGQYVVRVGRAVSTTTLDVEIELPILL